MHRREIIEIESIERGISISAATKNNENINENPLAGKMAKDHTLRIGIVNKDDVATDAYEKQVPRFLADNSEGGIFDAQSFKDRIQDLRREATSTYALAGSTLREMHNHMDKTDLAF